MKATIKNFKKREKKKKISMKGRKGTAQKSKVGGKKLPPKKKELEIKRQKESKKEKEKSRGKQKDKN